MGTSTSADRGDEGGVDGDETAGEGSVESDGNTGWEGKGEKGGVAASAGFT